MSRQRWQRPIADAARPRLFAGIATALVTAAIVLTVTAPDSPDQLAPAPLPAPRIVPAPAGRAADPTRATVKATARQFVASYLRYLYGQSSASEIAGGAPGLVREIAHARLRVPAGATRRQPRLVGVRLHELAGARWLVSVTVRDRGVSTFPIELVVGQFGARVRVTRVLGE